MGIQYVMYPWTPSVVPTNRSYILIDSLTMSSSPVTMVLALQGQYLLKYKAMSCLGIHSLVNCQAYGKG